eukprot:1123453-Amphidinium_carterae.2
MVPVSTSTLQSRTGRARKAICLLQALRQQPPQQHGRGKLRVKRSAVESRTQLVEWVLAAVGSVSSRPALTEQAWSFMSWRNKQDCEMEAEQLAAKGLLFWKGRGALPPEVAAEEEGADKGVVDGEDGADEAHAITEEDLHDDEQLEQEPKATLLQKFPNVNLWFCMISLRKTA